MKSGIYKILNRITNDFYIGSSQHLKNRKNRHWKDLKNNKHHSIILQRAVNKYNIDNFIFEILEFCEIEKLIEREQYYLDLLQPLYNISPTAGNCKGVKRTEKFKEKQRKYAKDNNIIPPKETWENLSKKVLMLEKKSLDVLKEFNSISEACRYINHIGAQSIISACCQNKRFSAYGYRWVYSKEDIINLRNKKQLVAWNKGLKIKKRRK